MTHRLTSDQARRIAVRAQRLDADRPSDVVGTAVEGGGVGPPAVRVRRRVPAREPAAADAPRHAALETDEGGRVAFLSPYDGMLFDRPRLRDLFGFEYVLEQFKPKPQRRYGFFEVAEW